MNRTLSFVNLAGVLVLALLCALQWQANRRLQHLAIELKNETAERARELNLKDQAVQAAKMDLDQFRQQLADTSTRLNDALTRAEASERELAELREQLEQHRITLTNWADAVQQRDQRLVELREQLQQIVTQRDDAIARFNDLAVKHNALVEQLEGTRTAQPSSAL
jgi:chromosome segregation ATPase